MRDPDFDIDELIEGLKGTCSTVNEQLQMRWDSMDEDDLTDEDVAKIDNEIFLCVQCGWWCEVDEEADEDAKEKNGHSMIDQVCTDCAPED